MYFKTARREERSKECHKTMVLCQNSGIDILFANQWICCCATGFLVTHRCQGHKCGLWESRRARCSDWTPGMEMGPQQQACLALKHIDRFQWTIQGKALAKKDHKLTLGSSAGNLCLIVILTEDISPRFYLTQCLFHLLVIFHTYEA